MSEAGQVRGAFQLEGWNGADLAVPLQVQLVPAAPSSGVTSLLITALPGGTFHLTGIPAGSYIVLVKKATNLSTRIENVLVPPGQTVAITIGVLRAGDADDNDVIDIRDFGVVRSQFGTVSACGRVGPNPCADFDGTGTVDLADFAALRRNFGLAGGP